MDVCPEYLLKVWAGKGSRAFRKRVNLGSASGPFRCNPKASYPPSQWHLIVNLSQPPGRSANDRTRSSASSLCIITSYSSVNNLSETEVKLGWEAQLAKVDIKSAYRVILVYPEDRMLLELEWEGKVLVKMVLHFGLRSVPKIFNAVADALLCVMLNRAIKITWMTSLWWGALSQTSANRQTMLCSPRASSRPSLYLVLGH